MLALESRRVLVRRAAETLSRPKFDWGYAGLVTTTAWTADEDAEAEGGSGGGGVEDGDGDGGGGAGGAATTSVSFGRLGPCEQIGAHPYYRYGLGGKGPLPYSRRI